MRKKIGLNVLYNLALVVCFIAGSWGYENKHYEIVLAAVLVAIMFIVFKIRLIKEVRNIQK